MQFIDTKYMTLYGNGDNFFANCAFGQLLNYSIYPGV